MIIQNTINGTQVAPPDRRSRDDAPKAVLGTSNTEPTFGVIVAVESPSSAEQLKTARNDLNEVLRQSNQNVQFEFSMDTDTDTKKPLIRVVDTKTGELIRSMPSEECWQLYTEKKSSNVPNSSNDDQQN